jgi:hypothetical protein
LISENKRVLGELFSEFPAWHKKHLEELESKARDGSGETTEATGEGDWGNIFDVGDAMVQSSMKKDE